MKKLYRKFPKTVFNILHPTKLKLFYFWIGIRDLLDNREFEPILYTSILIIGYISRLLSIDRYDLYLRL